jgi:4-hydroxybenzoate polyprenyltransferase
MTPLPQHLPAANDGPPLDPPSPQPIPRGRRVIQVQRAWTPFRPVPRREVPRPVDMLGALLLLLALFALVYGLGTVVVAWLS